MLTKKAKLEQFDRLNAMHDVLIRYFWDSRKGYRPQATAKYRTKDGDRFKASVYRTDLASGGYIVIDCHPGMPMIQYYEEWRDAVARSTDYTSEYILAMKSLAEQLATALRPIQSDAA